MVQCPLRRSNLERTTQEIMLHEDAGDRVSKVYVAMPVVPEEVIRELHIGRSHSELGTALD